MVPEPSKVDTLHRVAQLQVADTQDAHRVGTVLHVLPLLLLRARLHGQEAAGRIDTLGAILVD